MPDIRIVPANAIMSFTSSLNFIERITQDPSGSLTLFGSGSTGRTDLFSIDGNNGRLFSVSDDLSDSLFSVNTIAGLPVIEAFANNTVVLGQYGQNVLVVTGSNVGIGTTSPSSKLHINTSDTSANVVKITNGTQELALGVNNSSGGSFLFENNSNALRFGTSGTERMRITAGGNVGIGTTTPQRKLDVISGANNFVSVGIDAVSVGQWAGIHFGYAEGANNLYRKSAIVFERTDLTSNNAQGKVHILNGPQGDGNSATLADAKLTIAENGNVGIGTTSPGIKFVNSGGGNSSGPTLGSGTVGSQALLAGNGLYGMYSGVSNSGDVWHQVQRNDGNTSVYNLLLQPNGGGVAINKGTTSPGFQLDITGTGNATTDFRAPIFYDSATTTYYVDPASTSNLQAVTVASTLTAGTSITAPIYYDTNDTTYYADPAGSSRLSTVTGVNGFLGSNAAATNPAYSFSGDTNTGMYNPTGTDTLGFATAGTERMRITAGGAMGLGVTPTNTAGRFEASNDIVAFSSSDKNWKKNIKNIDSSLEKLSQINGVEFDWIEDEQFHGNKGHDVGVIAQEIELILPEAVQTRESGMKAVQYDKIIPLLIEAIKELQKQIKELKK